MKAAQLPPPVQAGDRVGVAALSGPVDQAALESGIVALQGMGFQPVLADNLASIDGMFAGSDQERIEAFHRLASDDDLTAIFFARGGHGVLRILPAVDWDLLAQRPRALVGYSDLTPFLLEATKRLGWVTFHGPMPGVEMARGLTEEEEESLLGALHGEYPQTVVLPNVFGKGEARGPLVGGCLSMLTSSIGTSFSTDFGGGVLFWEEVGEPLYRIDRMLTQLELSGALDSISGMIVGSVDLPEVADRRALRDILEGFARKGGWLVGFGFPAGHSTPNLTLPLGLPAQIRARGNLVTLGFDSEGSRPKT